MRKAAQSVIWASWLQIAVAVALAVLYFMGEPIVTGVLMALLVPIIALGNALLMRNAWVILSFEEQMESIEQTMQGEAALNRKLRAQRHDFVNHLQVVYSLLQLGEYSEAEEYLKRTYDDLKQVGALLRTRNQAVNALLAAKSMHAEQRHIRLSYSIRAALNELPVEDWQLCRVLGNLIDNALDAAAGQDEPCAEVSLWEELDALCFAVSNNGPPIPAEIMGRIFEPGFTTKGDRGTGMGLYIIRTLIEQWGGRIEAESNPGMTKFTGRIPLVSGQAIQDKPSN